MLPSTTKLFSGDQFVGYKVDPTTGDLVLRYVMIVANKPDANGRGITTRVMEENKTIAKGRPLIYAPTESQGGTKGHTNTLAGVDPYKFEIGRIVNIEPASDNLITRLKNNMIQTNSSYSQLFNEEKDLWVADVIVTNDQAKSIFLNPATSHLIPRYVSPSFIHARNMNGDYSKVDDAILDHLAIVNKPMFDASGRQIDGAAYGEVTKLRGACFGDRIACLNLLQTSSNKVVELDKCVSCPVQLLDRLTSLYKNLDIIQIEQSSSQIVMSSENNNNNSNTQQQQQQQQPAQNQVTTQTTSPVNQNTVTDNTPVNTGQTTIQSPLGNLFRSDEQLHNNYNALKGLLTQMVKENANEFRNAILVDANNNNNNNNTSTEPQQQQNKITDNLQSGETQQNQNQNQQATLSDEQISQTLQKIKITEDELKNMKIEDIKKKFGDVESVVKNVLEEQLKVSKTLQSIREKEEKGRISNILPREAFTDDRGFNKEQFDKMVNDIYKFKTKAGMPDDYITLMGVGLATLKNEQIKLKQQQINLKKGNLPQGFGESIKQKLGQDQQQQQQQTPTPAIVFPPPPTQSPPAQQST